MISAPSLPHDAAESLRRPDVGLNGFPLRVETHSAPESRKVWSPIVLYRKHNGNGARRVTRRDIQRQGSVAESELLAVRGLQIPLRFRAVGSLIEHIPIRRRHDDSRAVMILKEFRATVVIGVSMRHDGVFDIGRVQTQLLHPAGDLFFDRIVKDGVEDDDALRRRDRPHSVFGLAEKVQVVKNLYGFGIPRRPVRRPLLPTPASARAAALAARRWPTLPSRPRHCTRASRSRPVALKVEQILKIFAGGGLCGSDVCIGSIVCILSRQCQDGQQQTKSDPHKPPCNRGAEVHRYQIECHFGR